MENPSSATSVVNPRDATLGAENAILTGADRRYHVPDYEGCLSVKSVVAGSAAWEAGGRRFAVHENSYLILNDRQRYTMTIDAAREVTTFCLFFKRGLVEDVFRVRETHSEVMSAGRINVLSSARDNIHTFRAGKAGARGIDFGTLHGKDIGFSFLDIAASPADPERRVYQATWKNLS